MALFSKKESVEIIATLEQQVTDLTQQNEQLKEADSQASQARAEVQELNEKVTTLEQSNTDLTEQLNTANAELETFDDRVEARAIEISAEAGTPPVPATKSDEEHEASIRQQYKAMPAGEERKAFRKQNAEILYPNQ